METVFDSKFEPLRGFNLRFNDGFKFTSGGLKKQEGVIYLERFSTQLGSMFAAATAKGLCLLEFTDRRMLENEFKDLQNRLKAIIVPGTNEHIQLVKKELKSYLDGNLKKFSLTFDTPGTEFQQQVWKELLKISYGKTCSYLEQAQRLGHPKAVRAVANANGMNRIAILIPCHRVIGSDGSLTGYAGGLSRKKWLLDLEKGVMGNKLSSQ